MGVSDALPRKRAVARRGPADTGWALRALVREGAHALLLVAAGAAALYVLAYLPSRLKTDALRTRRDQLRAEKEKLAGELDAIRGETRALASDPWAVERALRRRLGFLRAGERVLKID